MSTLAQNHPVNVVPPAPKLAILGAQHVLAFYAGAVVVPLVLGSAIGLSPHDLVHLINADLFTCGIATIIQSVGFWKVGVRMPLIQGVTFTAVSPMIAIALAAGGGAHGLAEIYGAVIICGLFTFFAAPFFAKLIKLFPPVVTGTVLTCMGVTLLQVAAGDAIGGFGSDPTKSARPLAYALGTLALIVVLQRIFKGFIGTISVLLGLVIGTSVALVLGDASFTAVGQASWIGVTTPFYFGWPVFAFGSSISMIIVMIITMVETTGDVFAIGNVVGKDVDSEDIARALRADGLSTTLGGIFNSFPYTCFAQNVGLVRLTGVTSRWVVAMAGGFMIILGLLPKAGAVVAAIPPGVLGGASLAMFASVAVVGIQTLSKVDLNQSKNAIIVSTSLALAMLVTLQPKIVEVVPSALQILFASGVTLGATTAILLNLLFHFMETFSRTQA